LIGSEKNIIGSPKKITLFLRFVLILATILVMTYSKKGLDIGSPGYTIALVYLLSNLAVYFVPIKIFARPITSFFTLLFDIVIITLAIYFSEGIQTDFYLVYFLAIFISAVGQNIGGSFVIAIVISLFYGLLIYRANPGISLLDSKFLIRIPFLFMICLVSSYWASYTRREVRKKEDLERTNIELKKTIEKEIAKEIELRIYHEKIINSVPSGIVAVKRDGFITTWNPEAVRALGLPKDKIEGYNIKDITELLPLWVKIESSIASGEPIGRDEIEIATSGGGIIPLGFSTSLIYGAETQVSGCVIIFKDLSQVRALEEKLKQAERLSYLGKMASWVAHEIRNPLTAITGFAQLLPIARDTKTLALYSTDIQKGADRVNHIIDDILSFARSKEIAFTAVDLRALAKEVASPLNTNIEVTGIGRSLVKGEYESLRRVFVNLMQNAVDALGKDGKITIDFNETGDQVITKITDNGKGIPDKEINRLFVPFFTTKDRGTGLGLAIVKKIIDEHKGTVEITSTAGIGTTCRIALQKADDKEHAGSAKEEMS
jgi:two-component system sensor histidine kinase PilS (NtrC family)